jgi:hypothetical protein
MSHLVNLPFAVGIRPGMTNPPQPPERPADEGIPDYAGEAGGAPSAEEAAMHEVPED